jgi:PKHD-type hydroxylase
MRVLPGPDPLFRQRRWATLPEVLSPEECDALIAQANGVVSLAGHLVGGRGEAGVRRSDVTWLADTPDNAALYMHLTQAASRLNHDNFRFALDGFEEEFQLARYRAEVAGHYDWHIDRGGRAVGGRRKLTLVVQLSDADSYEGGTLELNVDGVVREAPRWRGTAIAFPAYALHRVAPVTKGIRYSLTAWLHGPDFT